MLSKSTYAQPPSTPLQHPLTRGHPRAGDGSTKHLDNAVDLPGEIELQDGVYEVGREEPADVVIPVPTVSGRHALLRISEFVKTRPSTL